MAADLTMKQVLMELKAALGKEGRRGRPFHIMLIGASGAGKTSFLNFIGQIGAMNSLGFDGMVANLKLYNDAKLERAPDNPMVSKTSATMSYDMKIGDVALKITDTPGLGVDTAGFGKAKDNVQNIIEYLKTMDYLDCICLVINGRTPSGIPEVKFALSEISAILPNVAANNMIVCLTNCEKISKATLNLRTVNDFFKTTVADREKIFCFDNPLCILENARRLSPKEYVCEIEDIKHGFTVASKEFTKFLYRLKECNAIPTTIFMEVYEVKQAIEREIIAITVHQYNQDQLEKIGKTDHRKVKFSKVVLTEDHHYSTLCDHPGCYSICHLQCCLPLSYDTAAFKNCSCMAGSGQPGMCGVCKHSYVTHYHHFIRFDRQEVYAEYENILSQIKQESSQALKELSATIEKFNKISSAKNFVQVLQTQLEVVKIYKTVITTPTEELKSAETRLVLAMATIRR